MPESQLDRFLMSLELNYASKGTEIRLLQGEDPRAIVKRMNSLFGDGEFATAAKEIEKVKLS